MTTTRLTALLLTALVMAAATCAAQQGPKPGYTDPLAYAQDYYTQEAENATSDPVTYAGNHSSAEAIQNETEEAAYIACWTAWHYSEGETDDVAGPVCDAYFPPPGEVSGEVPHDEEAANAPAILNETLPVSDAFLNETLDAVNDTLADPAHATSQHLRILNAN